jgi:hypothetical protein
MKDTVISPKVPGPLRHYCDGHIITSIETGGGGGGMKMATRIIYLLE